MRRRSVRAYTIPTAALELTVSEKTVRRWIATGWLSAEWVEGRGGGSWRITPPALEDARRRHTLRTARHWVTHLSAGAYRSSAEEDVTRYGYSPPHAPANVPVHRATVHVTLAEWRHLARRPRPAKAWAVLYANVLRQRGLSAGAIVRLRVRFELDAEDLARVVNEVVRSVRPLSGRPAEREDLQSEAKEYLLLHGPPALLRVRDADPLHYLRRMVKNFYLSRCARPHAGYEARAHGPPRHGRCPGEA